jgi:PhnB protein
MRTRTTDPPQESKTMSTTLTPYLAFDGTTREAFRYYEQALGARIETMMSFADMPKMPAAAEGCEGGAMPSGDGIMHARLVLPGGAMLFAGDAPPGMPYQGIHGAMLALQYDTVDEAQTAFHALSQGGKVTMPLTPTFWAKTFGMVTDRFGVSWGINGAPVPMP